VKKNNYLSKKNEMVRIVFLDSIALSIICKFLTVAAKHLQIFGSLANKNLPEEIPMNRSD